MAPNRGVFRPQRARTTSAGKPNTTPIDSPTGVPATATAKAMGHFAPPSRASKAAKGAASKLLTKQAPKTTAGLARCIFVRSNAGDERRL
jgi:hypothetical protein